MMKRLPTLLLAGLAALALWMGVERSQGQSSASDSVRHYDDAMLSKPAYRMKVEIDGRVPMRDGVALSTDIYRPDADGRFPAILIRTPYNNNTEAASDQSRFFAERGYVMIQ